MPDKKFDLGDYVQVNERIRILYELYPQARLVTEEVQLSNEPDGVPRVLVKALAYRTPDDPHPGSGWSWMVLPGSTTYTRGSELENTETSAWGRAIASLGILVDRSIASAQEVQNKQGVQVSTTPLAPKLDPAAEQRLAGHDPGGMVGIIEESSQSPGFLPTPSPEGEVLTFKLKGDGRGGGIKVIATGLLATQLADAKEDVLGARVTAWGPVRDESYTNKAGRVISYPIVHLERISTPVGAFPIVPAVAEGQVPFDLSDEALA